MSLRAVSGWLTERAKWDVTTVRCWWCQNSYKSGRGFKSTTLASRRGNAERGLEKEINNNVGQLHGRQVYTSSDSSEPHRGSGTVCL